LESHAQRSENVLLWHAHILKDDIGSGRSCTHQMCSKMVSKVETKRTETQTPQRTSNTKLVFLLAQADARSLHVHNEAGDTLVLHRLVRGRHHQSVACLIRIRDPSLRAVHDLKQQQTTQKYACTRRGHDVRLA